MAGWIPDPVPIVPVSSCTFRLSVEIAPSTAEASTLSGTEGSDTGTRFTSITLPPTGAIVPPPLVEGRVVGARISLPTCAGALGRGGSTVDDGIEARTTGTTAATRTT
jgi:hypothetical protein